MFRIFLPQAERNVVRPRRHNAVEVAFGIGTAVTIVLLILFGEPITAVARDVIQKAFSSG